MKSWRFKRSTTYSLFTVNIISVIIDKFQSELQKRNSVYDKKTNLFRFLTRLDVISDNLLKRYVNYLVKVCSRSLKERSYEEFKPFINMVQIGGNQKWINITPSIGWK